MRLRRFAAFGLVVSQPARSYGGDLDSGSARGHGPSCSSVVFVCALHASVSLQVQKHRLALSSKAPNITGPHVLVLFLSRDIELGGQGWLQIL